MGGLGCGPLDPGECRKVAERIQEICRAYSNAARDGISERWWKIGPDYARGGAEVVHWSDRATNNAPALAPGQCNCGGYSAGDDLMASIRNIARGG